MSLRGSKSKRESRAKKLLREQGFDDGYAGRPAVSAEAAYQTAWRRGLEARTHDQKETA